MDMPVGYGYVTGGHIHGNTLRQFGMNLLTGEAENIWYLGRYLFDLNEHGKALIERFLGGTVEVRLGSNWNSQVNGEPAVGSVMLVQEVIPKLAVFCALMSGRAVEVWNFDHDYAGKRQWVFLETEADVVAWKELAGAHCTNVGRFHLGNGGRSDRSVHQMSGREV